MLDHACALSAVLTACFENLPKAVLAAVVLTAVYACWIFRHYYECGE